jgi:hypothetical protein
MGFDGIASNIVPQPASIMTTEQKVVRCTINLLELASDLGPV